MKDNIMPTYASQDIRFVKGDGAWLWNEKNEKYLDALSGIAVCSLGHANPEIAEAISAQASTLLHTSNLYRVDKQEQLAAQLCTLTGMDNVFFANSGAEANEAAIKVARKYAHSEKIENPLIVTMNNSFHGRTLATLTATGNPKVKEGFSPLPTGFIHVDYNDISALEKAAEKHSNIVAILVEPIQGEGGVRIPDNDYLNKVSSLCQQNDWLLMLDEIQTGVARTGAFLASQHNDIKPDVITLAKALGNGVPIGACLCAGKAAGLLTAGSHGSTFGGNPLACASALKVLQIVEREQLASRAEKLGDFICKALSEKLDSYDSLVEIRHKGLMIGIELDKPCTELVARALNKHLLINVVANNTIRLLPPLIISDEQAEMIVNTLSEIILTF
ncbi:MAG: acetylornithine aminotransferase [Cycloclasticus sp. symbiont of Poecilosclerida sp. M]|nr:MAG: acetylornithine aminotransferase [Cycloclasticus sp. symbiont of Poecilosclerida sp. M]